MHRSLTSVAVITALAVPAIAEAKTIRAKAFKTTFGVSCKATSSSVTCTAKNGKVATVTKAGKATLRSGGKASSGGATLKGKDKWTNGPISCGIASGPGISCYSNTNGHGFYMSASGANKF